MASPEPLLALPGVGPFGFLGPTFRMVLAGGDARTFHASPGSHS
jgi:hypothetical protein